MSIFMWFELVHSYLIKTARGGWLILCSVNQEAAEATSFPLGILITAGFSPMELDCLNCSSPFKVILRDP